MSDAPDRPSETPDLGALSALAPQLAQTFVSVASDIALVIDSQGVIRNVALGNQAPTDHTAGWLGRPWADTVTGDTRRKIELLLSEARSAGVTRRREVNHAAQGGQDIPVAYAAVRLGRDGPVLAVGRDLRSVAAIQQRYIDAQQELERDYWQRRQAESRYRTLFQVATDAVLVVDAQTLCIVDANRAAGTLFGRDHETLIGERAVVGLATAARPGVEALLVSARSSGRPGEMRAHLASARAPRGAPVDISATPLRSDEGMLLLVRVRSADDVTEEHGDGSQRLADFVERTPDAVVITDSAGRVLNANRAFLSLCEPAPGGTLLGRSLGELLGDEHDTLAAVLSEARRQGIAEQRSALVGRHAGPRLALGVSAALLADGDQECLGLTLRRIDPQAMALPPQVGALAEAIDRLASQVGLAPLPELLQETRDLVERHFIDCALQRAPDDLPQAARLLGIGTEDLLERMRHHGLQGGPVQPPGLLN